MLKYLQIFILIIFMSWQGGTVLANHTEQNIKQISSDFKIPLSPKEQTWLKANPVIKVSNELNFPPFDFTIGGHPTGYSIDLLNILAKKIGISIRYINGYSWPELMQMFKQGELDLLQSLSKTPRRKKIGIFSQAYRRYQTKFVTREESPDIISIDQLYGKKVAAGQGWATEEFLKTNYPQINVVCEKNINDLIDAVSSGKAYAMVGNDAVVRYTIKKTGITNLKVSGWFRQHDKNESQKFYFMAQKDDTELISMLNKALNSISLKELEILNNKWFGNYDLTNQSKKIRLSFSEQNWLDENQPIKMCVDPSWMPYEQINNKDQYGGMGSEFMDIFIKRLGIQVKLYPTKTWSQSLLAVKQGKCDILPMAQPTTARKEYLDFTLPYAKFPCVVATRSDQFFIEDIEHFMDRTFTVVRDYPILSKLKRKYPEIKLLEVDNITQGIQKVIQKKAFGYIGATASIAYNLQQNNILNIKIAGQLPQNFLLGVATTKTKPVLHSIFSEAVDSLTESEKERIYNKWIALKVKHVFNYSLAWKFLLLIFSIVIISIYWNFKLKQAKSKTEQALRKLEKIQIQLKEKNKELKILSITDSLTDIYNRLQLDKVLGDEFIHSQRFGYTFGVILLDIDHFKKVNDNYGHQVGDHVLIHTAQILNSYTRSTDTVGRWGGEEFLIICPQTSRQGIEHLAEDLREIIEDYRFPQTGKITASFGVSMYEPKESIKQLISRVDDALYLAKNKGRNRVESL